MKILITGANGQLGHDLVKALSGFELAPLTHDDIEISDMSSVKEAFRKYQPDAAINTTAYVRVDDCETHRDGAYLVNAIGARNIAVVCEEIGAKLVQISTDYVFGGDTKHEGTPYNEFDDTSPLNVYGKSKLAGEEFIRHLCSKHFIVRVSGLFGTAGSSGKGGNFIETMIQLGKERPEVRVVNDQVFSPTYTADVACVISNLIATDYYGIFHCVNHGSCSWYDFTQEIFRLAGIQTPVIPITSAEYPQKAKRPPYSVLDNYHLRLMKLDDMQDWREALKAYLGEKGYLI